MARYSETLRDPNGVVVPGALVSVLDAAGALAPLTNDDDSALANPFPTDTDGGVVFNTDAGFYTLEYRYGGRVILRDRGVPVGVPVPDPALNTLNSEVGAAFVGSSGPSNVQTDLNARPTSTALAASSGATLVGYGTGTVADELGRIGDKLDQQVSLLDALTDAERADVLAGTNALDITAKIGACVAAAAPGSIIDATKLRGTVTLTADPFAAVFNAPVTLLTGPATFKKDFNDGPITLPSNLHWNMAGTEFHPTAPVTSILTDASPASAMLMTKISSVDVSGVSGANAVTLLFGSDAARIVPGAMIGIFGINAYTAIQHTLSGAINASAMSFAFNDAAAVANTLENSLAYLLIDDEILLASVSADGTTATVTARGALGTTAASHANGATITLMSSRRYQVLDVSGTTVTLSGTLPRSFTGAKARIGAVNTRLSGRFTIDGEYPFDGAGGYVWSGLSSVLSSRFLVDGGCRIRRCPHGGFLQMGCNEARVSGHSIVECGRPSAGLGSAIWSFGGGTGNRIEFPFLASGYLALTVDNKSFGVPGYGLIEGDTDSVFHLGYVSGFSFATEIASSQNNTVIIDVLGAGSAMPRFDNSLSSGQTTSAVDASGNVVIIHNTTVAAASDGPNASLNTVIVGGVVFGRELKASATVDPASLADGAGATGTVTVTGAALGDYAQVSFDKDLQGLTLTAYVSAADTVAYRFQNESGGTLDLASGTLRARVVKA